MKIDFKCEIKPPAGGSTSLLISESLRLEPNHLNGLIDSFMNESRSCCSETQNSAVAVLE